MKTPAYFLIPPALYRHLYMKRLFAYLFLLSALVFPVLGAYAAADVEKSFVTLNVGVELGGVEAAVVDAAEGLTLIGESLNTLASNPELTEQQRERIMQTLSRLDQLSTNLNSGMKQLPETVRKGMVPIADAGGQLSSQVKKIIIITAVVLILFIIVALLAVYYFVLAPGTRSVIETTELLNKLANTLESTAQIVEKSSQQNLRVLAELRDMREN